MSSIAINPQIIEANKAQWKPEYWRTINESTGPSERAKRPNQPEEWFASVLWNDSLVSMIKVLDKTIWAKP